MIVSSVTEPTCHGRQLSPGVIWIAVVLGLSRFVFLAHDFNVHVDQSYQALAHFYVACLAFQWWQRQTPGVSTLRWICLLLFGVWFRQLRWDMRTVSTLTNVELLCTGLKLAGLSV